MNYLVKWQFTKENPIPLKTQLEIIQSNFIPLVEDESFQEKKYSFYITRVWDVGARLAIFTVEENLKDIKSIVKAYTRTLVLHPRDFDEQSNTWKGEHNNWDGQEQRREDYTFSENPSCDEYFHTKYLEDIAWIGLGLHRRDLADAIRFAVRVKFETQPFGNADPRGVLHSYFQEASDRYRKKNQPELDEFWGESGFYYTGSSAPGDHFYYNIVLGRDFSLRRPFSNFREREDTIDLITQEMLELHGLRNNA